VCVCLCPFSLHLCLGGSTYSSLRNLRPFISPLLHHQPLNQHNNE
jgi:hypothetical protein